MNVTTLNMTTLDGNVIIKKGGGGTPTPMPSAPIAENDVTFSLLALKRSLKH